MPVIREGLPPNTGQPLNESHQLSDGSNRTTDVKNCGNESSYSLRI
jgi:hypothetical protein